MIETEKLLEEIYNKTGQNIAELLSDYEVDYPYEIKLKFRGIYKKDNIIYIEAFDEISECGFELSLNENGNKLELVK